ncbi:MAG: M48 family metalloprotease [Alphaproteobacteria bacterium]|nr:M48 family metalloprotease [Alphaproteobacteria bacterium]
MEKTYQKLKNILTGRYTLIPLLTAGLLLLFSPNASAGMTIISDEETELYLQDILHPIFQAANIPFDRNKIFIVQDNSLNAFVGDGNNLFIHSGTIISAKTDDEIRGVLSHEAGHILGGHIIRYKLRLQEMQNISLASMVLAGALGAASGRGDVALAVALGSHSSLINQALAYQIQEERSADEAAVKLLEKTHRSPRGLFDFMKKIQTQNKLQGIEENPYFRTHPMSGERLAFLQQALKKSPYPAEQYGSEQLKRIQAKLYAFIKAPQQTSVKYPLSDQSIPARYAQSIAAFKNLQFHKAQQIIDNLINNEPNNPHFRELKAQILFEQGKIKEARQEFSHAVQLRPSSINFKISEAQASLELSPSSSELKSIIAQLQKALTVKPSSLGWLLLSRAYHLNKQEAEAQYAAARYTLSSTGNVQLAKKQAELAKKKSQNPQLTIKIEDLLNIIQSY